jgi:hypothetical protein
MTEVYYLSQDIAKTMNNLRTSKNWMTTNNPGFFHKTIRKYGRAYDDYLATLKESSQQTGEEVAA